MKRLILALGILAAFIPSAPATGAPAGDYFPLNQGTVWVYRTTRGPDLMLRVSGTGQVGDVTCTLIESISNGMVTQRECFRREGDTVFAYVRAYPSGNVLLQPPQPMLRLPPSVGQAWLWEGKVGDGTARLQLQWARTEQVTVPAGTYAAAQLYLEGTVAAEQVQSWRWYAPGVGMVKEDSILSAPGAEGRGIRIVAELREFRPGR